MHEKTLEGCKLDSDRQFCFMEKHNAGLTAFFSELLTSFEPETEMMKVCYEEPLHSILVYTQNTVSLCQCPLHRQL